MKLPLQIAVGIVLAPIVGIGLLVALGNISELIDAGAMWWLVIAAFPVFAWLWAKWRPQRSWLFDRRR